MPSVPIPAKKLPPAAHQAELSPPPPATWTEMLDGITTLTPD
jgi:hypothetical protein